MKTSDRVKYITYYYLISYGTFVSLESLGIRDFILKGVAAKKLYFASYPIKVIGVSL